jgi:hypothetical protein
VAISERRYCRVVPRSVHFADPIFHEQASRLAHFLDGCSSQLDAFMGIKREMGEYCSWE